MRETDENWLWWFACGFDVTSGPKLRRRIVRALRKSREVVGKQGGVISMDYNTSLQSAVVMVVSPTPTIDIIIP